MNASAPRLSRILDGAALDAMHAAALRMLERTGLAVENAEIRAAIAGHPGFTLDGGRVRIAPGAVEAWVADHRARKAAEGSGRDIQHSDGVAQNVECRALTPRFAFGVSDRCLWVADRDGTTLRPATRQDCAESARLIRALHGQGVRGGAGCVPCDVPVPLQPLEQFLITARYAADGGSTSQVTDADTAAIVRDLNRVYGRPFGLSAWCPSPLMLAGTEVDILWRFRHEVKSTMVGTMPIMGLTGPCDPIGVFTLAIAECIGGATVLAALLPGVPVGVFPHPEPADLRTGSITMGTPEWQLLDLMHRDVLAYYGAPWNTKLLHTSASLPGAQAQIERTACACLGMLAGYREFLPLGQLGLDEVWSPAQVLLDLDILGEAARLADGAASGAGLALAELPEVVNEVVCQGLSFAEHETTLANFRAQYHAPRVLQRMARGSWTAAGRPDVVRAAQAEAERLAREPPPDPPLDILRELEAVCRRAGRVPPSARTPGGG